MGDYSLYFDRAELACSHCGKLFIDPAFLEKLELARTLAGIAFIIVSGFRCPEYNKAVGSTSQNHVSGRAVDIKCERGSSRRLILNGLMAAEFNRIGIHKTFIHADTMDELGAPKSYWMY
ncbi:MAG: D-Ala-D-Ala carboxypeptidase family metallohydrolase [Thermodesulfobacteriota bacterium]|nr:D-Ala-D-Ala carboxypeptidase family metallohydrolase [Thermodesulfobacteriota bacterium]